MATANEFGIALNKFKALVRKRHVDAVKATAKAVHVQVVNVCPIDTSRAKSNWQMTLETPASQEVPFVEGRGGSSLGEALSITTENRKQALSRYRFGQDVWVSNVVPYIVLLDDGKSPQYPGGFTLDAIQAAKTVLRP